MSLARTALRLAAIEALKSHPVIAARCPGRVYDSRIGDFQHREPVPVIIVTTEELHGEPWNGQNGGGPWNDACDLVLEIAQTAFVETDDGPFLFRPETDRELEAALDLLEECADWMVTLGRVHLWARTRTPAGRVLIEAVTRRVVKRSSSRFASDDTGAKLAIHLLTFRVQLKGEDTAGRKPPTGPFASLPDPLRTVAASMPADSSGLLTCQMIAAELAAALDPPPTPPASGPATPPDPVPGTLPVEVDADLSQGA